MKNYDFHQLLEPLEFQEFARDMIQVREKIDMEAFREGPDQGIDARCITPEGKKNKYHKQKEPLGLTSPVSTGK